MADRQSSFFMNKKKITGKGKKVILKNFLFICFLILNLQLFSQDISREDYLDKMGYHKISNQAGLFYNLVTQSAKSRGYYYYRGDYFREYDHAIMEIVFANDSWLPFGLSAGMELDKARDLLLKKGGLAETGGWIMIDGKYKLRFNGFYPGNEVLKDVVVVLTDEELNRRRDYQQLIYKGIIFQDIDILNCYMLNAEHDGFIRFDAAGSCQEGNCVNGQGTKLYEEGLTFYGTWNDSVAISGYYEYKNRKIGKYKVEIELLNAMPDGKGVIYYGEDMKAGIFYHCGIADKVIGLHYPGYSYSGPVDRELNPIGAGRYVFNSGKRVHVQRIDFGGKTYAHIDFVNGSYYDGYINDSLQMHGRGILSFPHYGARMETVFRHDSFTDSIPVLLLNNGFRQQGDFDLSSGFSGMVDSWYECFDGKYLVRGEFDEMVAVGEHILKEVYTDRLIGNSEYDSNGNLISGHDLYFGDSNSLMYFKQMSDHYLMDLQQKVDATRGSFRAEGWQIIQQFQVDMEHKNYQFRATYSLPAGESYRIIILDPSGRCDQYKLDVSRAGEEIGGFNFYPDQALQGLYSINEQLEIPGQDLHSRPGPSLLVMDFSALGIKGGKHLFYVFVLHKGKK